VDRDRQVGEREVGGEEREREREREKGGELRGHVFHSLPLPPSLPLLVWLCRECRGASTEWTEREM
jgi:hypothetical protein